MKFSLFSAVLFLLSSLSQAAIVDVTLTGEVTRGKDFVESGDVVTISFSYDTDASGDIYSEGQQGYYGEAAQNFTISIATSEGDWVVSSETGSIAISKITNGYSQFQASSTTPPDSWTSPLNGSTPEVFKIELTDNTNTAFVDVSLPESLNLNSFDKMDGTVYFDDYSFFSSISFVIINNDPEPGPSNPLPAALSNAELIDDTYYLSDWMGGFFWDIDADPQGSILFTKDFGWVYLNTDATSESTWWWSYSMNIWLWGSEGSGRFFFRNSDSEWLYVVSDADVGCWINITATDQWSFFQP